MRARIDSLWVGDDRDPSLTLISELGGAPRTACCVDVESGHLIAARL